eukprot:g38159.t1
MALVLGHPKVLTHYDPKQDLVLTCDTSPYGIGIVLAVAEHKSAQDNASCNYRDSSSKDANGEKTPHHVKSDLPGRRWTEGGYVKCHQQHSLLQEMMFGAKTTGMAPH